MVEACGPWLSGAWYEACPDHEWKQRDPIRATGQKYGKAAAKKVERAMHEMKRGKLVSGGSGKKVKSRKQAIAIGLAQARRAGAKVPKKKSPPEVSSGRERVSPIIEEAPRPGQAGRSCSGRLESRACCSSTPEDRVSEWFFERCKLDAMTRSRSSSGTALASFPEGYNRDVRTRVRRPVGKGESSWRRVKFVETITTGRSR